MSDRTLVLEAEVEGDCPSCQTLSRAATIRTRRISTPGLLLRDLALGPLATQIPLAERVAATMCDEEVRCSEARDDEDMLSSSNFDATGVLAIVAALEPRSPTEAVREERRELCDGFRFLFCLRYHLSHGGV